MKKIKLAFLISTLDAGGAERQLINTVNALPKESFEIKLFILKDRAKLLSQLSGDIQVKVIGINAYVSPKSVYKVISEIRLFRPQILHSQMYASNILARVYKMFNKPVFVVNQIHGLGSWIRKRHIIFDRFLIRYVDKILVVSKKSFEIRSIREKYPASKLSILYNSIDATKYMLKNLKQNNASVFTLGMACRLVPLKQVDKAIELVLNLRDLGLNVQLKVAGDGPEKENLLQLISKYNLDQSIELLSFVEDMPAFYNQIDCFLVCSKTEDLPLSIVEAFSSGRAAISTNIGGIPELFENTYGLLVNDLTQDIFSIKKFIENFDAKEAAQINSKYAKLKFDLPIHTAKLLKVYESLLH